MNFTSVGGRRFAMTMGAGITSTVLVWFGKITPEVYSNIIMWTVAAYIAGGTVDNTMGKKTKESE
jgi:integral membrane sensor domain MASE1